MEAKLNTNRTTPAGNKELQPNSNGVKIHHPSTTDKDRKETGLVHLWVDNMSNIVSLPQEYKK